MKGILGMLGVVAVVLLVWPDRAEVRSVTRPPPVTVTNGSPGSSTAGPSAETSAANPIAEIPENLSYDVVGQDVFQTSRRSLDVRLSQPVDESVLEALAYKLRDEDSRSFPRTFIVYYLPGMTVGEGGWATSHFDPELTVQILGLRPEASSRLSKFTEEYGESLVGAWENNQVGFASTFVIHEAGGEVALEQIFPDGSARTIRLREESATGGRQFRDPENPFGEYWLVRQGNLEARDAEGVIYTARPISNSP